MSKKIEDVSQIKSITEGDILIDRSDGQEGEEFKIQKIDDNGGIMLIHFAGGNNKIKLLSKDQLLSGNWWVKIRTCL